MWKASGPSESNFTNQVSTPLQQLIEDINFQRSKESRIKNCLTSDGFVFVGQTFWTEIFVRHFLFQNQEPEVIDSDDLLFFVRKRHIKGSSRTMPKYDTNVEVFRKDSRKLPIGDPDVDFEETVYLNLIIHQFEYILTLAICTRTSPKELQVLKKNSQKVFASPSRRRMDAKGDSEEITYPNICFMIDNFDEVFQDIEVRDGEMVCVELVAKDKKDSSFQGVIFLGSIRYDALKKVYDARQSSLGSKVAQRMTFGLFNSTPQTRCEFVRMKGPGGRGGFAEMAVSKPKGQSGIETPSSEPGFGLTDMYDSENEEEIDDYFFKHQRRLSDPSSNLNNFSKGAWKKNPSNVGSKARSENEGLDSLANDLVSEIIAGNVKDENRPVFSSSESKLAKKGSRGDESRQKSRETSSTCFSCFKKMPSIKCRKGERNSIQLSEIYCPRCSSSSNNANSNSASSTHKKTLLNVESEIEYSKNLKKKFLRQKQQEEKQQEQLKKQKPLQSQPSKTDGQDDIDFEYADDAIDLNLDLDSEDDLFVKVGIVGVGNNENRPMEKGKEEFPEKPIEKLSIAKNKNKFLNFKLKSKNLFNKTAESNSSNNNESIQQPKNLDLNPKTPDIQVTNEDDNNNKASTLPLLHKNKCKKPILIPKLQTSDGTTINFWCDLPKKYQKELDDGQLGEIWTHKGFNQTFHFLKENRRQNCTPLNAFLTYISLPFYSISKDLLDHRENPILTF